MFADVIMLLPMRARGIQGAVDEYYSAYLKWKQRVNVGKSKVMAFEREGEVCDISSPYRCEIVLDGERTEEVQVQGLGDSAIQARRNGGK